MHSTPLPNSTPDPVRRSSVVPLSAAGSPPPAGTTDHVPTIVGENLLARGTPNTFDLPVGSTLGHFEVKGPLGAGGMATVFKAKDLTLGRDVALKILPPQLAADPDAVSRFKFEARAAAKLNHDHVARVFYIGEDRGLHFIAFEFVDGRTLREVIDFGGSVSAADAVRYLLDVAVGLQHAADRGVVHRDVKPSNIIVTPGGRAKLIDMGLARSMDPHSVHGQVTQSGMTLGTFDYISPEQAIDPRRADVRSDIYSLGCTFYHALTGQTPVPDGNAARKLAAHQTESPTDPRLINPTIPDELATVLDRMMAKLPAHRYQSADELIADLNRLAVGLGLASAASEPSAALTTPAAPATSRNHLVVISLAVAVVAMAVAVVVLVLANNGQQSAGPPLPWNDPPTKPSGPVEPPTGDPVNAPRVPAQASVGTAAELVKALKDGVPKITLAVATYDLSAEAGAVLTGKTVELDCPDSGAVLRLTASPRAEKASDPRPGTITFHKCESVKLRGLRVEFAPPADARGVGLLFHDVGTVDVSDCRFTGPGAGSGDGSVLAFTKTGSVVVRHGFFQAKGWAAVELPGGAKAEFTECGFVVGRAAIEVTAAESAATVTTTHVTCWLNNTAAAVSVLKGGRCDLTAGFTLFAAPPSADPTGMMERRPVVIRSADADLNTFSIPEGAASAVYLVDPPTGGATPTALTANPWATPPKVDGDPFAQLELNTKLPPVRVGKSDILGVREWNERRRVYTPWPLPPLVRPGEVVWFPKMDPTEQALYPENVYADLKKAVAALNGKGTLLVRGNGNIPTPSLVLDSDTKAITVRPDADSAPVLVPADKNESRLETTLFRLEGGELVLENLQFAVKPGKSATAAAVVAMTGGRKCEFKKCVLTLDELNGEQTAAVSLADVTGVMKKGFTDHPAVSFEQCLIRGRGRVVRAAAAIHSSVSLSHVGIATDGGPAFDLGPPTRTATVNLTLSHVTAAIGGPLLDVRGARRPDDKPTGKVELHADNCLFVATDKTAEPLVRVTALDPTATDRPLAWSSAGGNAFGGWQSLAEILSDETTEPKKWDAAEWRKWSGEPESSAVQLKKSPTSKATAKPSDLEPSEPTTAGADLKKLADLFRE